MTEGLTPCNSLVVCRAGLQHAHGRRGVSQLIPDYWCLNFQRKEHFGIRSEFKSVHWFDLE